MSRYDRCLAACCSSFRPNGWGFCKYPVKYCVAFFAACCISRWRRCKVVVSKQFRSHAGSCVSGNSGMRKLMPVWLLPMNIRVNACMVPESHWLSRGLRTQPSALRRPAVLWRNLRALPRHTTRATSQRVFGKPCLHLFGASFFWQAGSGTWHLCLASQLCMWCCWCDSFTCTAVW